jgi:hypothetical protein
VPEPEIRANHSKHTIARIKTLAEPDRSRILQQIELPRARIREASVFDWLPVHVHVQLVAGITEMLPPVRALAFYKSLMADAFSKSLLRPIVQGAIAIHGRTPKSLLRMSPRTWSLISRNAGTLSVDLDRGAEEASACFQDLPPAIAKSTGMLQFFEGGLCAAVEHFGATPRVRVDVSKLARGEARFEVSWQAAS